MTKKQLLEQIERARQISKVEVGAGGEMQFEARWNLICQVLDELVMIVMEAK